MPREEAEAFGLFAQQHGGEVAVADADLALIGDRTGDAESLQSFADGFRRVGGFGAALFDGDGGAEGVCPARILEGDGLYALHDVIGVEALFVADALRVLEIFDPVLFHDGLDLLDPSFVTFKRDAHSSLPPYCLRGSMYLTAPSASVNLP